MISTHKEEKHFKFHTMISNLSLTEYFQFIVIQHCVFEKSIFSIEIFNIQNFETLLENIVFLCYRANAYFRFNGKT